MLVEGFSFVHLFINQDIWLFNMRTFIWRMLIQLKKIQKLCSKYVHILHADIELSYTDLNLCVFIAMKKLPDFGQEWIYYITFTLNKVVKHLKVIIYASKRVDKSPGNVFKVFKFWKQWYYCYACVWRLVTFVCVCYFGVIVLLHIVAYDFYNSMLTLTYWY